MATRARIGIQQKSGRIIASYQHWDGYPGGLGFNLIENWEDPKKVISVRFSDESGGLRYLFWSNDIQYDGTEAKITKDIWYHLCVTYSGGGGTTKNKKLYLNKL